jgi:serine phosphatase RsbU (regulator of sigma subunit)
VRKDPDTIAAFPSDMLASSPGGRVRGVLTVTGGPGIGRVVSIVAGEPVTLGRSESCTVSLGDPGLSRVHGTVRADGGEHFFSDAGSRNGSLVNDKRVTAGVEVRLRDGDRLRLGPTTRLRFTLVDEAEEQMLQEIYTAAKRADLLAAVRDLEAREGDRQEDLLQAREFQRRAMPEPPEVTGVGVEIVYRPLDLVGGDLHHVSTPRDGLLRVFVADATGHGIKASLTTMLILSEYEAVRLAPVGPAEVLRELNERVARVYSHLGMHFTAVCMDIDAGRRELRHASAAHPGPLLVRAGAIRELAAGGPLMGLASEVTFPEWTVPLLNEDVVLAFTDGATEAFGPSGEPFGDDRLAEALRAAALEQRPAGAAVSAALDAFVGAGKPLGDDLTLVTLHFRIDDETATFDGSLQAPSEALKPG